MPISALIVRVPEAEPLVSALRARYDATAVLGVPAHITILVPFMSPEKISAAVLTKLRQVLSEKAPFKFTLNGVGRWTKTTYLRPDPPAPFVELTQAVLASFPVYLPYEGQFNEIVPHLTVADGDEDNAAVAEQALVAALQGQPAVASLCSQVELLENSTRVWRRMHVLRLGAQ